MRTINYPISINYMSHWSLKEAIRELLQNAIDTGGYTIESTDNGLVITNEVTNTFNLDNLLLLGETTKAASNTIGKFGEGFKLALLVLAREQVEHYVFIDDCLMSANNVDNKLTLTVQGEFDAPKKVTVVVDHPEAYAIACKLLARKQDYNIVAETKHAKAMLPAGALYVGGLRVCDLKGFNFSYDFSPSKVQLDRDRATASTFDLAWAASELWVAQTVTKELLDLIYSGAQDVQYVASVSPSKELIEALYDHYLEHYGPKTVLAESAHKAKALEHLYQRVVYVGSSSYNALVTSNKRYMPDLQNAKRIKPADAVQKFVDENTKHMRSKAKQAAKKLRLTSMHW